jgi:ADP-ribose pyrophosphatase
MKIHTTNKLYENKWMRLNNTNFTDKDGHPKQWCWVERVNTTKAVNIVATMYDRIRKEHLLVVIKEYRIPIGDYEWGFPAGLVENDESAVIAAERELKEETGLEIDSVLEVTPYVYNSAGLTNESSSIVYCVACGEPSDDLLERSEDIKTYLLNRRGVRDLLSEPDTKFGAKAYIIMDLFAKTGRII